MYNLVSEDYLMHHGVKGMKWGVRRQQVRQAIGYGRGSRYMERRSIRNLKQQKKQGRINNDSYKSKEAAIRHKAAAERGKKLVEANQNYGKIIAKSVLTSSAFALSVSVFGPIAMPGVAATSIYNTKNAIQRSKDIYAYRKYGNK